MQKVDKDLAVEPVEQLHKKLKTTEEEEETRIIMGFGQNGAASVGLDRITAELLSHILSFLGFADIVNVSLTCKYWRDVVLLDKIQLRIIMAEDHPVVSFIGFLFRNMSVMECVKAITNIGKCRKEASEVYALFCKGHKITWQHNYLPLYLFNAATGDTIVWKPGQLRAFIYDCCWYPSPPYKCEIEVNYLNTIEDLRYLISEKIGHKPYSYDILYRGLQYGSNIILQDLLPTNYSSDRIIFNIVRRNGAQHSDFSTKSDKDRQSRYLPVTVHYYSGFSYASRSTASGQTEDLVDSASYDTTFYEFWNDFSESNATWISGASLTSLYEDPVIEDSESLPSND